MKHKVVAATGIILSIFQTASGQSTNLIGNGSFESPTVAPWFFVGGGAFVGAAHGFALSGLFYLNMGSMNAANQRVGQSVTIPSTTTVAVLNYYRAMLSSNPAPTDHLRVFIMNTNAVELATVDLESNTGPQGIYFQHSVDMNPFIGQTVLINFKVTSDPVNGFRTTYYIDDVSLFAGSASDIPSNDNFANRVALTGATVAIGGVTNTFASKEAGEPAIGGNPGGRSLWWTWSTPTGGVVTLKTTGSGVITLLGVYTGTVVSNLTAVATRSGVNDSGGFAQLKFNASPGVDYAITMDGFGGTIGELVMNLTLAPDTKVPTVSFTSPSSGARLTNSTVTVQGKASDNLGIDHVEFRLENATGTNSYQSATGTNTWSATVNDLIPGPNTVRVRSVDLNGNLSTTAARTFTYVVTSPLTLTTNGIGTVSPNLNGQALDIGINYTITAKPGAGQVFAGWTGGIISTLAKLTFAMQTNLVLQANFIPNPFIPVAGNYQALFYDTNGVATQSAGFFTAAVKSTGAFSGKVSLAGKSYSLSGQLTVDGSFSNSIVRKGLTPLSVQLQVDMAGDTINGRLSDGVWSADLFGHRAVFSKTNLAPQIGKYTLLIPGGADSVAQPGGDSVSTIKVDSLGNATFAGTLADGTKLSQKTFVAGDGQMPFFASLYKGSGLILGWLTITNSGANDIEGLASWIKLPQTTAKFYPLGFTNETAVIGSVYTFTSGVPVLNMSTGVLWVANGNLSQSVSNQVVLSTAGKLTGISNSVSVSITTSSGTFKGTVPNPTPGGKAISVNGVVLQKQNFGGGYFSGTNQIGRVQFSP